MVRGVTEKQFDPPSNKERPTGVLILSDYYLPGFKAGGPIRTLANIGDRLGSELRLRLITRDRDFGDTVPYPGVQTTGWQTVGNVQVAYRRAASLMPWRLFALIRSGPFDVLYLNSLFSAPFTVQTLVLRWLGLLPRARTVLAPRGELADSALSHKRLKKRVFLQLARAVGLYRNVWWQASSAAEADDIRREFGASAVVVIAPDLGEDDPDGAPPPRERVKTAGALRVVFLSRLVRQKNLEGALEAVRHATGHVEMDVFGPREDAAYWTRCERLIAALPQNVVVRYRGAVPRERVLELLPEYDLLLFPTRGENFGHVVLEALLAALPVLISDRTPWRGLEACGAGWDLPLERPDLFLRAIEDCTSWDESRWRVASAAAWEAGRRHASSEDVLRQSRDLLGERRGSAERHLDIS
jgi:glycosyltransferase involved in cell wall biosynthesis